MRLKVTAVSAPLPCSGDSTFHDKNNGFMSLATKLSPFLRPGSPSTTLMLTISLLHSNRSVVVVDSGGDQS